MEEGGTMQDLLTIVLEIIEEITLIKSILIRCTSLAKVKRKSKGKTQIYKVKKKCKLVQSKLAQNLNIPNSSKTKN